MKDQKFGFLPLKQIKTTFTGKPSDVNCPISDFIKNHKPESIKLIKHSPALYVTYNKLTHNMLIESCVETYCESRGLRIKNFVIIMEEDNSLEVNEVSIKNSIYYETIK